MPSAVDEVKVRSEVNFWMNLYGERSHGDFGLIRQGDFEDYAAHLPEIRQETGIGLDLGSGPWSVFERQGIGTVYACDRLMEVYGNTIWPPGQGVYYVEQDAEELRCVTDRFDFVWCVNVIDHTPNPERVLAEVRRVLKPGGHFYFGVWFDPSLGSPHYRLWNEQTVESYLGNFTAVRTHVEWWGRYSKNRFWGIYE